MKKSKKHRFMPEHYDHFLVYTTIFLIIFGSIMVVSAEMGESVADLGTIGMTAAKQALYFIAGGLGMIFLSKFRVTRLRSEVIQIGYFVVLGMLLITRLWRPVGGAYGWIRLGPISIQPSEFAKLYTIILGANIFAQDHKEKNIDYLRQYFISFMIYVVIVLGYQNDLGSAFVIGVIGFCICLVPNYRELRKIQTIGMWTIVGVVAFATFMLSSVGTSILMKFDGSYKIMRFLASADPFAYQYDSGYHLVMSLVSFATGGWFGLGYGKSIHKFMNFPNPSTDFILPVVVEELGLVFGLMPIVIGYFVIFFCLIGHSLKCKNIRGKIVLLGTFVYFAAHFILNIGGVSGFIPLTGVPLLLISAGGSATMSIMMCVGLATCEIANYRKKKVEG